MTAAHRLAPLPARQHGPVWLARRSAPLAGEPIPEEDLARAETAIADVRSRRVPTVWGRLAETGGRP